MASRPTQRAVTTLSQCIQSSSRSRGITAVVSHLDRRTSRSFSTRPSLRAQQPAAKATPSSPSKPSPSTPSRPATTAERPPTTARSESANAPAPPIQNIAKTGLADTPNTAAEEGAVDWTTSFAGLSTAAFAPEVAAVLLAPLAADDIEVKPDGIVYLPEIKYRRILNRAFGPGGWGLAPRGETIVTSKAVTREYALLAHGRLISIARGEQDYFDADGIPTATEGCKSNALMRCCKDLGVASELWDPRFLRRFLRDATRDVWVEHAVSKKRRKITVRKDDEPRYPYLLTKSGGS